MKQGWNSRKTWMYHSSLKWFKNGGGAVSDSPRRHPLRLHYIAISPPPPLGVIRHISLTVIKETTERYLHRYLAAYSSRPRPSPPRPPKLGFVGFRRRGACCEMAMRQARLCWRRHRSTTQDRCNPNTKEEKTPAQEGKTKVHSPNTDTKIKIRTDPRRFELILIKNS